MNIIHIASELAPVAKVGGLGDVTLGLCRELSWKGHSVDIIIPYYDCLDPHEIRDLSIFKSDLVSTYNGEKFKSTIWLGWVENLKVYFVDLHHPRFFFNRGCFYGCDDDIERYLCFSRVAFDFIQSAQLNPQIIHLHDWQTAVIASLSASAPRKQEGRTAKTVFTIHNIEYQGKCSPKDLNAIGLDGSQELSPSKMQDNADPNLINLLKGAFVYADYITTVSPNYAKEILTKEGGRNLESTLQKYQNKFSGILNGVDYSYWNPEIDRWLPCHYSSREVPLNKRDHNTLNKKAYIKRLVRERLNLEEVHKPIIGCIARLVPQKGIDLIEHAIKWANEHHGQFLLLGSSPIPKIQEHFHHLQHLYTDHPNIHLSLRHEEELAHLIYAASDMFIVPSLFEPCGLTQMIALKYGSIPIVRKTGGLADTIFDVDNSGMPLEKTNGYVFEKPTAQGLDDALNRAFDCWFHHPDRWRKLLINGMNIDFSWNLPSNHYLEVYNHLLSTP